MYIEDFDYYLPATLEEACLTLTRLNGEARVLAGGTDLLPNMKNEVIAPKALVSLKEIEGLAGVPQTRPDGRLPRGGVQCAAPGRARGDRAPGGRRGQR